MTENKKNSTQAFTLIELLVVISIITLFSSVILAGVSTLRAKAQEAAIKSDLKSVKNQAELSFNNTGDYSMASSAVSAIIDGINKSGGSAAFFTLDNTHYAVSAKLNSNPKKLWSVSDIGDIVVWDKKNPMIYNGSSDVTWYNSNTLCANFGERLPTIEELKALYYAGGTTGSSGFASNAVYWSSTEYAPDTNQSWIIFSGANITNHINKTYTSFVNCVH